MITLSEIIRADIDDVDAWMNTLSQEVTALKPVQRAQAQGEIHRVLAELTREQDELTIRSGELGLLRALVDRIRDSAECQYQEKYQKALLYAALNAEKYPNQETQKAHASDESFQEFRRLKAVESMLRMIQKMRSDIWKRLQALKEMGQNARAEAYSTR
jgi:hypothetical protein